MQKKNKNNFGILVLVILILFIIVLSIKVVEPFDTKLLTSIVNNKNYLVQDYNNKQKAANIIGQLEVNISIFVNYLKKKYPNDDRIKRLINNLDDTVYEEAPHEDGESTYTINKGELMKICLREKKQNKPIHNINTLMFVVIHELGHVCTKSIGHTDEWMNNFRFLLREATKANIDYEAIDYSKNNMNYCGVEVTHNPYFNHI